MRKRDIMIEPSVLVPLKSRSIAAKLPATYALHCRYPDCALPHRRLDWNHGNACHPLVWWQTNGNAALSNVSVCESVDLVAMTAYKCHAHQMDSMIHAPDNAQAVYFYKLDQVVDNANYHLKIENKIENYTSAFSSKVFEFIHSIIEIIILVIIVLSNKTVFMINSFLWILNIQNYCIIWS